MLSRSVFAQSARTVSPALSGAYCADLAFVVPSSFTRPSDSQFGLARWSRPTGPECRRNATGFQWVPRRTVVASQRCREPSVSSGKPAGHRGGFHRPPPPSRAKGSQLTRHLLRDGRPAAAQIEPSRLRRSRVLYPSWPDQYGRRRAVTMGIMLKRPLRQPRPTTGCLASIGFFLASEGGRRWKARPVCEPKPAAGRGSGGGLD